MASRLKNVVRTLNARVRAKAPAHPEYTPEEGKLAAALYADMIGVSVDADTLAAAKRWDAKRPKTNPEPYEIPDRLRITADMPAKEAAARYAELLEWTPPRR